MDEVAGSSPASSTGPFAALLSTWQAIGFTLGGLVAGEGSFYVTRRQERFTQDGTPRMRFVFQLAMAQRDADLVLAVRRYLGCGQVGSTPPRRRGHQPISSLTGAPIDAHRRATIPFARQFLLPSAKRDQFESWVERMDRYVRDRPSRYGRGPSPCSVEGCGSPVRGRGLCRRHYYRVTGY